MKKLVAGGILLFTGVIMYLAIHVSAVETASHLGEWSTPPGRLGTAMDEFGGEVPTRYSIFLAVIGFLLLFWGVFEDEIRKWVELMVKYFKAKNVQETVQTED